MIDLMTGAVGGVNVIATQNRGLSPEELTELALDKLLYIGDNTHPLIAQQARAFKDNIRMVLTKYFEQAQKSERTTICAELTLRGHQDLADIIRRL